MIRFIDIFEDKYGKFLKGVPELIPGEYEVKSYWIFDDEKFTKTIYFDTTIGMYKTVSRTLLSSFYWGIGKLLQDQFDNGETVLIEFINKQILSGKYGLGIRTN